MAPAPETLPYDRNRILEGRPLAGCRDRQLRLRGLRCVPLAILFAPLRASGWTNQPLKRP